MDWIDVRYYGWSVLCLLLPVTLLVSVVRIARARRFPVVTTAGIIGVVGGVLWGYATAAGYLPVFLNSTAMTIVKAIGLTDLLKWPVAMAAVSGTLWMAIGLAVAIVVGRDWRSR